jgi:hypothetical protein
MNIDWVNAGFIVDNEMITTKAQRNPKVFSMMRADEWGISYRDTGRVMRAFYV